MSEAANWFRKAADQGFASAAYNLGSLSYSGKGVTKDLMQAYKWISIAAARTEGSNRQQLAARDTVAKAMSADQVAEASKAVEDWLRTFTSEASGGEARRVVVWSSLTACGHLTTRRLDNRIKLSPEVTLPIEAGQELKLASGASYGGPYDVWGIGTYIEVGNEWVTVCGVSIRNGSFSVTERGFEFSATTEFGYRRPG